MVGTKRWNQNRCAIGHAANRLGIIPTSAMHPAFVILDIAGGYPDEGQAGGTFHGVMKYHAGGAGGKNFSCLGQCKNGNLDFRSV